MKKWMAVVVFAGTLCSCGGAPREQPDVRSVVLTEPVILDSLSVVHYPGVVREAHSISLGFKTAGQIQRIYAQEGDYVRRGELLAELDDEDYRLGVEALQIQYDQLSDEVGKATRL